MARLVVVGAGHIGTAAATAAVDDGVVECISAVIDPDPAAATALAEPTDASVFTSVHDLPPAREGDRALVAFSPRVEEVAPVILHLLALGYHVVSTCEELAWPPRHMWNAFHTAARTHGRVIIMTGVNPGFVMDRLPLLATAASRKVTRVTVTRRIDSADRRASFLPKTGRGLSSEEFSAGVADGTIGHRGLVPSATLLAHTLGWPNRDVSESIAPVTTDNGEITGFHQDVTVRAGEATIRLDITAAWELSDPGDRVVVEGEPPVHLEIPGGYQGDLGAAAQVVVALRRCTELTPSFYRPTDLPLRFG